MQKSALVFSEETLMFKIIQIKIQTYCIVFLYGCIFCNLIHMTISSFSHWFGRRQTLTTLGRYLILYLCEFVQKPNIHLHVQHFLHNYMQRVIARCSHFTHWKNIVSAGPCSFVDWLKLSTLACTLDQTDQTYSYSCPMCVQSAKLSRSLFF